MLLPTVPPTVFRNSRTYNHLVRCFRALDRYLVDGARDRYPATRAGLLDISAACNEQVFGNGDLARAQRQMRDQLIEQARQAAVPLRRRKRAAVEEAIAGTKPKRGRTKGFTDQLRDREPTGDE